MMLMVMMVNFNAVAHFMVIVIESEDKFIIEIKQFLSSKTFLYSLQ